ncbi:alpha/beta hydrolase [Chryseobacterium sp. 1B4]
MSTLTLKDGTEIFYKDQGQGPVLMFHHGWPLSSDDWDAQVIFFYRKATEWLPMTEEATDAPARTSTITLLNNTLLMPQNWLNS